MNQNKSSFGNDRVWFFDDLAGEERRLAIDAGCEPGKAYFGDPYSDNEVPLCPFCNIPVWQPGQNFSEASCGHLVAVDDMNGGLMYLSLPFAEIFWRKYYDDDCRNELEVVYDAQEISEMKGRLEVPVEGLHSLAFIEIVQINSIDGTSGGEFFFVPDGFLSDPKVRDT